MMAQALPIRQVLACVLVSLLAVIPVTAEETGDLHDDLLQAAAATRARMATDAWTWETYVWLGADRWEVQIVQAADRRLMVLTRPKSRTPELVVTIQVADGLWHVQEGDRRLGRFRPYEAPISNPEVYRVLFAASPRFYSPEHQAHLAFDKEGKVNVFREPTFEESMQLVGEAFAGQAQRGSAKAKRLARIRESGVGGRVSPQTGLFALWQTPEFMVAARNFAWLPDVPAVLRDAPDDAWPDHSRSVLDSPADQWLLLDMQLHAPVLDRRPEPRLLNIKTGELRRVPFVGYVATGLAFAVDRRTVYLAGGFADGRGQAIIQVDLGSGLHRRIDVPVDGGHALIAGATMQPGGERLILLRKDWVKERLEQFLISLPVVVDLKTGANTAVGERIRGYQLAWPAGDAGVLFIDSGEPTQGFGFDLGAAPVSQLRRLQLDGSQELVAAGISRVICLADGRLLVCRAADSLWYTCDADGQHPTLLADGMPGWTDPAPAPDGKSIAWLKEGNNHTQIVVIPIGAASGKSILDSPGSWWNPIWR